LCPGVDQYLLTISEICSGVGDTAFAKAVRRHTCRHTRRLPMPRRVGGSCPNLEAFGSAS
jgi:hypothetical protein